MENIKKAQDRLDVLENIKNLESQQKFDVDPENDPPTYELKPNKIDYKRRNPINKIKRYFSFKICIKMLNQMKENGMFLLNDVDGIENLQNVESGAILTCNHFGVIDSFIMELSFRQAKLKHKKLYRVIREGNYTNPPQGFKQVMRYCNTLPLSQNYHTMKKFLKCTNELIQEGNFVLVYPEEAMWWNYRKPRPLKNGAFRFAVKNNVPVIPCFVTMQDSDKIGPDGFPIQIHTMHIGKPMYPNADLTLSQNIETMKNKNFEIWKNLYETTYNKKLKYSYEEE